MSESENGEPVYDFGNWGTGHTPDFDCLVDEKVRSNLRDAFAEFAKGGWHVAFRADGEQDGDIMEWMAPHYDLDQPVWLKFTPAALATALLEEMHSRLRHLDVNEAHRETVRPMLDAIGLWRQELDMVEAEIRRVLAGPDAA